MEAKARPKSSTATNAPSTKIVERIADLEGIDPVELSPPLYSVIDPESLDRLFHRSTGDTPSTAGDVQFEYRGYEIRVQSDEEITILDQK